MKTRIIISLAVLAVALAANSAPAAFFYEYSSTVAITSFSSPVGGSAINGPVVDGANTATLTASPGNPALNPTFLLAGIINTDLAGGDHLEEDPPGVPLVLATNGLRNLDGVTTADVVFDFDFTINLSLTAYADSLNDDTVNPPLGTGSIAISGHIHSQVNEADQTTTISNYVTNPLSGLFLAGTQPVEISALTFTPPTFGEGSADGDFSATLSDPNDIVAPEASSLAIWGAFGLLGVAAGWIKKFKRV